MPFVTTDNPGRAHETCWILDVRSLTNPLDLVILSPKTKGSVINQAEWNWSEDSANVSWARPGSSEGTKGTIVPFDPSSFSAIEHLPLPLSAGMKNN